MKPNTMVYGILIFGFLVAFSGPYLTQMLLKDTSSFEVDGANVTSTQVVPEQPVIEEKDLSTEVDLAIAPAAAAALEEKKEEVKEEKPAPQTVQPAVKKEAPQVTSNNGGYEGLSLEQIASKLDKSLHSNLSGTGIYYAKYALEYGVDPYLVTAISLHETGCNWNCSTIVKQCNNVGGMKGGGSYKCSGTSYTGFDSLESGIKAFVYNIKVNYYDKGLTTAEQMNSKYAASTAWSAQVNSYVNKIKNN